MSMCVLVCDKSVPCASALAGELRGRGVSVSLVTDEEAAPGGSRARNAAKQPVEGSALAEPFWNRASPLSARTLMLETSNVLSPPDQAALFFDAAALLSSLPEGRDNPSSVIDGWIAGYVYLVRELVQAFSARGRGRILFAVTGGSARGEAHGEASPGSPSLAAALAESAFIRLAEETAAFLSARVPAGAEALLVRVGDESVPESAAWLASRIIDSPMTGRSAARWVKTGSRDILQPILSAKNALFQPKA